MHLSWDSADSTGKTSSIAAISRYLEDNLPKDIPVYTFHQPGDTNIGNQLRSLVKDPHNKMTPLGQLYSMAADHAQFAQDNLKDIKDSGKDPNSYIILQDRVNPVSGWVSNVSRYGNVTPEEFAGVYNIIHNAYPFDHPDIIIILTLPSEQIIENLKKRGFTNSNRFEASHDKDEWDKVVKGYQDVPSGGTIPSDKYITLDGDKKKPVLIANELEAILAHKNMVDGPIKEHLHNMYKAQLDHIAKEHIDLDAKKDTQKHYILNPTESKKIN